MKYKIIAYNGDWIVANKNNIICIRDFYDENYVGIEPQVGSIISDKAFERSDRYWHYTRKRVDKLNKEFKKIK